MFEDKTRISATAEIALNAEPKNRYLRSLKVTRCANPCGIWLCISTQ